MSMTKWCDGCGCELDRCKCSAAEDNKGFRVTDRGFHIKFANGFTVSVQFDTGNYCDIRHKPGIELSSPNAEIAAWDLNHEFVKFPNDTVCGWVKPDNVLKFMQDIAVIPSGTYAEEVILPHYGE